MKLYDLKKEDHQLLMYDLFKMVGLENASEERKDKFKNEFSILVVQYFLTEKVRGNLTKKQLEDLMEEYPPDSEENVDAMLMELGELLPEAPQMYVESIIEVKATLISRHYESKMKAYDQLAGDEKDQIKKADYRQKAEECKQKLGFIENREWAFLLQ